LSTYFKIEEIGSFCFLKQISNYPTINLIDDKGNPILNAQGIQKQKTENILTLVSSILGKQFYEDNENLFTEDFWNNAHKNVDSLLNYLSSQLLKFCTDTHQRKILYKASQQ